MLAWTPSLSVGIDDIDHQHQELFARVNRLSEAMDQGMGRQGIGKLLDFLADYVVEHFGNEERYMELYEYPGRQRHFEEHARFKVRIAVLKSRHEAGGVGLGLLMEIFRDVGDWLMKHVGGTDKAMGAYVKSKMAR